MVRRLCEGPQDTKLGDSGRGSAWLERLVRDQEVGGSNPLAPTNLSNTYRHSHIVIRVQTGSILDPTRTRTLHSVGSCSRVFIDLPSDDSEDPLGPYQEVQRCSSTGVVWSALTKRLHAMDKRGSKRPGIADPTSIVPIFFELRISLAVYGPRRYLALDNNRGGKQTS